ncbi:MAG: hypothetical protein JKY34_07225, partial [Kordiimonadaceae bacterium]|nr:hypothetical protein [Kordiimonadaceae bacterium]
VYGEGGDLISAQALTDALAQTLEKYGPDCSRDVRLHWASALFFMGGFYAKAGEWENARSTLARLEGLMGEHDDDLHVRQIWVEAVYQMVALCAASGKLSEARGLLNVLEVASQNTETRNHLNPDAQRADSLKAYLARGDLSLAWAFLRGLWADHEELSEIEDVEPTARELWQHAAGILVRCYDTDGEHEAARGLRDDLEAAVLGVLENEA